MTVREYILQQFDNDIPKITLANGYNHSVNRGYIFNGELTPNQVNQYPQIFYFLGRERMTGSGESDTIIFRECEAFIGIYFQCVSDFKKTGILTKEYEKWISDLKRFVQSTELDSDKKLNLSAVEGVQRWNIQSIEPYIDNQTGWGAVLITILIEYLEKY